MWSTILGIGLLLSGDPLTAIAQTGSSTNGAERVAANQQFHHAETQNMGLLIPMYQYPANIHTNADFNRVMQLKRQYRKVPFWVVINPASGPGNSVDSNYTKAIDRLIGAGCVVLGYVATGYGKASVQDVSRELGAWQEMYPRVHGIFFDEMIYENSDAGVSHQKSLNEVAHRMGYWPTIGNPGAETPGRYFAAKAADVIIVHEAANWPSEAKLHGNYFGGYADYPPSTRATLIHSQPNYDAAAVQMARQYTRWIYVTQDTFKPNDPAHPNPWDQISVHLESMCKTLSE